MASVNSLFDLAEDVLDGVDRIIGSPAGPERSNQARETKPSRHEPSSASTSTVVTRRRFRVVEFIDESGADTWVVTDGYDRAECSSAVFAARVRDALG